ncbi:MAG: hypothetical protein PHC95_05080 [Parabacteroides sp.]|nr:hypothetical protein [Parabacteroides sp.]
MSRDPVEAITYRTCMEGMRSDNKLTDSGVLYLPRQGAMFPLTIDFVKRMKDEPIVIQAIQADKEYVPIIINEFENAMRRRLRVHQIPEFRFEDPNKFEIENVIFNNPATIVIWKDGSKTVVKCQPGEVFSKETGLAMAISKRAYGNTGNYNEIFKKWVPMNKEEA